MDSEQGKPAKADDEREALEQPGEVHQALDLSEARAGEDKRPSVDDGVYRRVDHPPALASRGEPAAEHEAGEWQPQEDQGREQVVEDTVHAVDKTLVRGSRRIAVHRIGDEDSRAEQPDRVCSDQAWSPDWASEGSKRTPQTDGESQHQ